MKIHVLVLALAVAASAKAQSVSEPLGPSSRRTPIAISEIMYKPADRVDERNTEFIELYNSNPWPEDISGFRLDGQVQFKFPPQTAIAARGFVVVAAVPADLQAVYALSNVFGPYTNTLKTSGNVRLYDEQGAVLLNVDYSDATPWPMGADGTGHSIVLARASYGEGDPRAWARSELAGGSPGNGEANPPNPWRNVVLNEILAHTDPPETDRIELYNHSNDSVDLSGCTLSDNPANNKFQIPSNTVIPPRGFVYFTENELGFALDAAGETVYFKNPDASRVLDALRFDAQENGVSFGRYPDGAADWSRLSANTFGDSNAVPIMSVVGINEIMYHPLSDVDDDQYVELFNRGSNTVNLSGWKFDAGIDFTFPANTVIAPNAYLVVARNRSRLLTNYSQLNLTNTLGNFSGRLSGNGERLALTMPDVIVSTNGIGLVVTNHVDIVVDEVTYGTGGRWGRWSDGGGSSLELVDARADKRLAANWADSDETAKAPWATIEHTGVLDNGSGAVSPLQLGLLDAGECLVDDVEVIPAGGGQNYARNPGFEQGTTYLSFVGSHSRSSLATNLGYPSGGVALHMRTGDGVLIGPNGVQIMLLIDPLVGQPATLRYKARWLRGCPEPLLRFWGCYLEATGRLPVPLNLGTPGLRNSQAVTNAGPAVYQVRHDPAVPAANQPVVVTARVSDPDGVESLTLRYRFDPLTTTTNLLMNDAGENGDAIAGDGIYSAMLPGRPTNAVPFTLLATDGAGATSRFPELVQDNARVRECVIFFGEPNPTNLFGTYHLWLTQTNVSRWRALPIMSNEEIDGTLVYNNRVIYNMGGRYSGGPWHQNYDSPAGNRSCHYVWTMPKDDLLLGATAFNQIHWPGNDIQNDTITTMYDDPTLQREQAAYMFLRALGVPWMYRRFVAVYVNGVRRGKLMEDAFRPTAGTVEDQYLAGDSGVQFYKLQRWYEGSSTATISECRLQQYTTTGGAWKPARYRPNWALKKTPGSLSDFTNVYALVTAANAFTRSNYVDLLENVADMENWMRVSAANQAAGNWDAFGSGTGQNMDAWLSAQRRWTLFTIDLSICLDNRLSGVGLFSMNDFAWQRIINTPKFRRMYCRALNDLVNGVMQASVINPVMDAKYAAFVAAGVNPASPSSTKSWIASQRSSIISQLASVNAAAFTLNGSNFLTSSNAVTFTGTAPVPVVSISVNGLKFTPVWTTWNNITRWSLTVPAAAGTNTLTVAAYDHNGNVVGGTKFATVINSATPQSPVENVVFNEIMFNAPVPEAEYVELFNRSTNTMFDLSGWMVNGLSYTFPPGSLLAPQSYLVLARSRTVFAATYGSLIPVFDQFDGNLQSDGETLSLLQPGVAPAPDVVVDRVRYEPVPPWPTNAALRAGTSLQLIDPAQDNSRVSNWTVGQTNLPALALLTPGTTNSVRATLPEFPTLWLNEAQVINLTGPTDNFGERAPWVELYNSGSNTISLAGLYLKPNYGPPPWAFPSNASIMPGEFRLVWLDTQPQQGTGSVLHANFVLIPANPSLALTRIVNGATQIVDYLTITNLPVNYSYGDVPDGQPFYRRTMFIPTPFGTNNPALPPATVFVNEWMAENTGYLYNPATEKYDDWFELYNPADTPAEIGGYYLSDNLANRTQYRIPAGFRVPAHGFLLVWADDKTSANNTNSPDLHVPFKLNKDGEAIGLFTPDGATLDAVAFGTQTSNVTEGRCRDGGALRLFMPPTPRGPNLPPPSSSPPMVTSFLLQDDGSLIMRFATEPGHTYRVEYKRDLSDEAWLPLGPDQFATETTLTITDGTGEPQRYYRVVLVE